MLLIGHKLCSCTQFSSYLPQLGALDLMYCFGLDIEMESMSLDKLIGENVDANTDPTTEQGIQGMKNFLLVLCLLSIYVS